MTHKAGSLLSGRSCIEEKSEAVPASRGMVTTLSVLAKRDVSTFSIRLTVVVSAIWVMGRVGITSIGSPSMTFALI